MAKAPLEHIPAPKEMQHTGNSLAVVARQQFDAHLHSASQQLADPRTLALLRLVTSFPDATPATTLFQQVRL